jgi:lipid-A-disaccharide synthase
MKYYIIAGERSGDLHSSNLMKGIKSADATAVFRGVGGDYMIAEGLSVFKSYHEIAFMGIWEVIKNLLVISRILKETKNDILTYKPDAIILVDFGGFNMKMARFAKENKIPVHYYISPKIWAWNTGRAKGIKKYVDHMYCILPFEKTFYKQFDYEVDYVGNPVCDAVYSFIPNPNFKTEQKLDHRPVVAILAGSRYQEVSVMLDTMLDIIPEFSQYQFVVAAVSNLPAQLYDSVKAKGVKIITDQTYDVLSVSHAAIVTSGTATLETALFRVPQVVVYKTSGLTYSLAKYAIKVKYISLVNLIADQPVVRELIQSEFNKELLSTEFKKIVEGKGREEVFAGYEKVINILGGKGASERAGELIVRYLK